MFCVSVSVGIDTKMDSFMREEDKSSDVVSRMYGLVRPLIGASRSSANVMQTKLT